MALIDELKLHLAEATAQLNYHANKVDEWAIRERDLVSAIAALEAPAQPLDELRSVTPATEEESGDQSSPEVIGYFISEGQSVELRSDGSITPLGQAGVEVETPPDHEPNTLIDAQTCEEVDPHCSWKAEATASEQDASVEIEPVLDATILPQVTPDEVPLTAEVIHTDDGRKRFALFGGQTHEVVSASSNPDADFWAKALHPKPKVDA